MIASRPNNKSFAGFYEFPGGKVKKNEFLLEALKRELMEELSLRINVNKIIFLCSYQITREKKKIDLNFFSTNNWFGKVKALEKQEVKWIRLCEVKDFKMLASNKKIIDFLNCSLIASKN